MTEKYRWGGDAILKYIYTWAISVVWKVGNAIQLLSYYPVD